ncbi:MULTISPECIES: acyltransferase family protein [Streptomycetaceae]|uniref:Acyltransferase 3 n=1 Tax=Streptantibioticus cattleyicolor (strain ATCC 35852 / DSM 46488 / JCM 4925 / NBRC 14057 / NRRL 8057) TaxID=1003195 RepID=F8K2X8_STREN|nr:MULTISPECIES: acyltransferase [Streptomycetaceae]AEW92463.1 acyltransferase 3 [Streptantibioticus cattleyicolor NRRL 8057 = DSM 46488]MYS57270.1 acyltransferase family protein [Streptomyces sp. SID5468]CCB72827.1 4''-mycarosyl isovaleryl-CoA transferase [Streptantibioticus cattleyicolor NRRL 8057 = DSM 46488]
MTATTASDTVGRPGPGRLPSLTGMRFVAAALVFAFHATYENAFRDHAAGAAFSWLAGKAGWVGVSYFFVLSGFLLTWSARRDDPARRFWRRRFFRIYPTHLLTFLAALALLAWAGLPAPGAVRNLLLVQSWTPDVNVILSVDPVSWSLSCEALFYLAFPLLFRLVARVRPERLWWWAGALVAAVCCVPAVAGALLPGQPHMSWLAVSEQRYWFVFAFPPVRALEFVLGMVMARIVRAGRWSGPGLLPAGAALVAGYAVALYAPFEYGMVAVTLVPVTWLISAAAVADVRGTRSPFRHRAMVRLGEVSFAFYLVHRLVQRYGHIALGERRAWSAPAAVGMVLLSAVVSLLLAWLVHVGYERPVLRRFGSPARPPEPTGARPAALPGPSRVPAGRDAWHTSTSARREESP